ncbi:hypothetical protein BRC83_06625 [Halobacteriales archaeon QS_1_68_17]|nr:MAG: hypothetical protein BRC83_06625 [Halobacteriales archaeon QS_1_68_17]
MLLVVAYSRVARRTLRNACRAHEGTVVRRFGRAALLADTEFGAFQALRLRERHGSDVQIERTRPLNPYSAVPAPVREAAAAYESEAHPNTPYERFAAGTDHPSAERMKAREL